ncbi:MAG: hypothetical protein ACXW6T_23460, partial [Candidatus Binatia bacterium]
SIRRYATDAGRQVEEDHYGVLIPFYFADHADKAFEVGARTIRPRADMPTSEFTAFGTPDQARARVQAYIAAGATKFIMRPGGPFDGWRAQVEILAREVIVPLQKAV